MLLYSASAILLTAEIGIIGLKGLFGRLLASCLQFDRSAAKKDRGSGYLVAEAFAYSPSERVES